MQPAVARERQQIMMLKRTINFSKFFLIRFICILICPVSQTCWSTAGVRFIRTLIYLRACCHSRHHSKQALLQALLSAYARLLKMRIVTSFHKPSAISLSEAGVVGCALSPGRADRNHATGECLGEDKICAIMA